MNIKPFAALASAMLATAVAHASSGVFTGGPFSVSWTANQLELNASNTRYEPDSASGGRAVVYLETSTPLSGSFSATVAAQDSVPDWYINIGSSLSLSWTQPFDLRLSHWHSTLDLSITRLSDGVVLKSIHIEGSSANNQNASSIDTSLRDLAVASDYYITGQFTFTPGHYLLPSDDPSCASISCMILKTDSARFSAAIITGGIAPSVPEPASWALFLAGAMMVYLTRGRLNTKGRFGARP